jgi:hypothetical protein
VTHGRVVKLVVGCALVALLGSAVAPGVEAARKPKPTAGQRATVAKKRALLDRNLIPNGDGELFEDRYASGWRPAETLESTAYGDVSGEWGHGVIGAPQGLERYFRLEAPDGSDSQDAVQAISVAAESISIDAGRIEFALSGWFGGLIDGRGGAQLTASFMTGSGETLAEAATELIPIAELPRPQVGSASLGERRQTGVLPAGTRGIRITLTTRNLKTRECPSCGALGLADQLSLVLSRREP